MLFSSNKRDINQIYTRKILYLMDLEYKNLALNICYFSSSNKRDIEK